MDTSTKFTTAALFKAVCAGSFLVALAACTGPSPKVRHVSLEMVTQPVILTSCAPLVKVTVTFVQHSNLSALADAYDYACQEVHGSDCAINASRMRESGLGALAFHVENVDGTAELHYIPPKDFNDIFGLAVLGHEAFHVCGARHAILP